MPNTFWLKKLLKIRKIFCHYVREDMSITKYTVIRFSLVISLTIAVGLVIVIGDIASSSSLC